MSRFRAAALMLAGGLVLASGGCSREETASAAPAEKTAAAAPAVPSAGDREFDRLTAGWSDAARDACGPQLRDVLGTRDLVQGALDGVRDPAGKAAAETEDARSMIAQGNAKLDEVRPQLQAGACDGTVTTALDEATQFYVKAGTSAVQAGQIAGS